MQTWDWARLRSQSWIFFWHGHKMLSKDVNHHSHTYFTLWCEKLMSRIQEKPIAHSSLTIPKFWVKKKSKYSPTTILHMLACYGIEGVNLWNGIAMSIGWFSDFSMHHRFLKNYYYTGSHAKTDWTQLVGLLFHFFVGLKITSENAWPGRFSILLQV